MNFSLSHVDRRLYPNRRCMKRKSMRSFLLIPTFFVVLFFAVIRVSFGIDHNGQRMDSTQVTVELKDDNLVTALKKNRETNSFSLCVSPKGSQGYYKPLTSQKVYDRYQRPFLCSFRIPH